MSGTLAREKRVRLYAFLGTLPDSVAAQLADAVERDRASGGTGLPYADILTGLRPQLRKARHRRRFPTPQRLFCRQFSDFLVDQATVSDEIARDSLDPIWQWLSQTLLPSRSEEFIRAIQAAILAERENEIAPPLLAFSLDAAKAIKSALGTAAGRDVCVRRLGSHRAVEDAGQIADVLLTRLLNGQVSKIRSACAGIFEPSEVLSAMKAVWQIAAEFTMASERDDNRRRRGVEARDIVSDAVAKFLETAPEEIRRALPLAPVGGFGGETAPLDLHAEPDLAKFERARDYARLLAGLDPLASPQGLTPRLAMVRTGVGAMARAFNRGLVRELKAGRPGSRAEAYRQPALVLCAEILAPAELTELTQVAGPAQQGSTRHSPLCEISRSL